MEGLPSFLKIDIAKTAMGMEALTVKPTFNPKYTLAAPNIIPNTAPSIMARGVNSGINCCADIKGLNFFSPGVFSIIKFFVIIGNTDERLHLI
jgi:hypothetical protein